MNTPITIRWPDPDELEMVKLTYYRTHEHHRLSWSAWLRTAILAYVQAIQEEDAQ